MISMCEKTHLHVLLQYKERFRLVELNVLPKLSIQIEGVVMQRRYMGLITPLPCQCVSSFVGSSSQNWPSRH